MANINDISKATGFSKSTVSKALNNSQEISKKTKTIIKAYAKKVNFKPNYYASQLRKNEIKNVGIIIPSILNNFFTKVLKGAQKEFYDSGYDLVSYFNEESPSKERQILKKLKNGSVAGLLISLAKNPFSENITKNLLELNSFNIPIVMFYRISKEFKCDKVYMDNYQSTFDCVKHLVSRGKKKIALVSQIHDTLIGKDRYNGYVEALKSEKINFDKELYLPLDIGDAVESEITKLCLNKRIDAIISIEQQTTVALHNLILNIGLKIPKDIAIIGFTNDPIFKHIKPSITSMDQHGEYFGKLSAKLLIDRIQNKTELKKDFREEKIPFSLIHRESS